MNETTKRAYSIAIGKAPAPRIISEEPFEQKAEPVLDVSGEAASKKMTEPTGLKKFSLPAFGKSEEKALLREAAKAEKTAQRAEKIAEKKGAYDGLSNEHLAALCEKLSKENAEMRLESEAVRGKFKGLSDQIETLEDEKHQIAIEYQNMANKNDKILSFAKPALKYAVRLKKGVRALEIANELGVNFDHPRHRHNGGDVEKIIEAFIRITFPDPLALNEPSEVNRELRLKIARLETEAAAASAKIAELDAQASRIAEVEAAAEEREAYYERKEQKIKALIEEEGKKFKSREETYKQKIREKDEEILRLQEEGLRALSREPEPQAEPQLEMQSEFGALNERDEFEEIDEALDAEEEESESEAAQAPEIEEEEESEGEPLSESFSESFSERFARANAALDEEEDDIPENAQEKAFLPYLKRNYTIHPADGTPYDCYVELEGKGRVPLCYIDEVVTESDIFEQKMEATNQILILFRNEQVLNKTKNKFITWVVRSSRRKDVEFSFNNFEELRETEQLNRLKKL